MPLHVNLLGQPQLLHNGRDVTSEITAKPLAVLGYLAICSPVPRDQLASLFWSDKTEEAARYRLRHTLWELRKTLSGEWIDSDERVCSFSVDDARVDVLEFQRGLKELGIGARAFKPCADDAPTLTAAAALYRGELMQGLIAKDAPLFEEWLVVERERLQLLYLDILGYLAEAQQLAGDEASAARTLERLIQADPLRERSYRLLMGIHHRRGDRAAALNTYKQCATVLKSELGAAPSPETERVRALILKGSADSAEAQLPRVAKLIQQGQSREAWTLCASIEALTTSPVTRTQAALWRAEIALQQDQHAEALSLVQNARQALAHLFDQIGQ